MLCRVDVEACVCVASSIRCGAVVQRREEVESSRVESWESGGLDRGDDHDDEDDQIVFFWPDGAGCVWGVATEWINAVCAGEAVGSVDWYDRMGWI